MMFVTFRRYQSQDSDLSKFITVNTDRVAGAIIDTMQYDEKGAHDVSCSLIMTPENLKSHFILIVEGSLAEVTEKLNGGLKP